ncbi:MAG: hypothetical protein M1817_004255 [Caeruleum heppii]|nr:MAG: hypothetical protein M1817_004255 [Caeruleum heppii]
MAEIKKRKADVAADEAAQKRNKDWRGDGTTDRLPRQHRSGSKQASHLTIEPGDTGIWATCDKGREGKCIGELRDLFGKYAEEIYGDDGIGNEAIADTDGGAGDIEAEIRREVECLQASKATELFTAVRLDVQCVLFFRTQAPIEPVSFVHRICHDARHARQKQTRYLKRLTPVTLMSRAYEKDLDELARKVLAPHFHGSGSDEKKKKFAIRPTIRNHSVLTRAVIIQRVAAMVGPGHQVDLKNYDLLILVEVYKNVCGMSVVGGDYDELKKYNLAELHDLGGQGTRVRSEADGARPEA